MVERSLSSLPRFLSESLLGGRNKQRGASPDKNDPTAGVSRGFEIFIQNVNRSTSKHYERQVVDRELGVLRQKISQAGNTTGETCDHLCRAIYCHMLGYDVKFASIHAVTLAQRGSTLLEKRLGYLATSLLLRPDDELILLLINTIQRDLRSSNMMDNCMGLMAASQLVGPDMIPSLLPLVLDRLKHQRELVRQKAVLCLYKFQLLAPDLLQHVRDDLDTMLHDKDPGVMAATLNIIQNNIQNNPGSNLHVADSLVSILDQVVSRRMSAMFEYHSVPFPWLQIQILRCLGDLGAAHTQLGTKLSPLLLDVLQRASSKDNIAYAILYECIRCITRVKLADRSLLDEAAKHVARFVRSAEPNFKYIGVKALTMLVEVDSQFAVDYQNLIVESLDTADHTLQRKMYVLLYKIANSSNVQAICTKLLLQLETSLDKYWRSEVVTMVIDLAHRLPTTDQWKYETIFRCIQLGHDCVRMDTVHSIINELNKDIRDADASLSQFLIKTSVEYLMRDNTAHCLIHILAWCLGELALLLQNIQTDKVISLYTKHLSDPDVPSEVKACLVTGLQKLLRLGVVEREALARMLQEVLGVEQQQPVIKQRLLLLYCLAVANIPAKPTSHDERPDYTLSFLDSYISERLEAGALPYKPVHLRHQPPREEPIRHMYEGETRGPESLVTSVTSGSRLRTGSSTSSGRLRDESYSEPTLNLSGVKRVWRKEGRLKTALTVANSDVTQSGTDGQITREDMSNQKVAALSEDERRKRDLTRSLFAGIQLPTKVSDDSWDIDSQSSQSGQSGQSSNSGQSGGHSSVSEGRQGQSKINEGVRLPVSDAAGWRSLHEQRQQSSVHTPAVPASVSEVRATYEPPVYHTDHQQTTFRTKSEDSSVADILNMCKTDERSHQNREHHIISEGDSSIETYMTCNSSVNLKSPISPNEPIENMTGSLYNEPINFKSANQNDSFEFESTNRNVCDTLANQNLCNLESSNGGSLNSANGNEAMLLNIHNSSPNSVSNVEIENVNYLSMSDKSSIYSMQGSNSESFKVDNSAYVNISLCSNDSTKVSVSEICVNNNVRSQPTEMVLPHKKHIADPLVVNPRPYIIHQSMADEQSSIYGTVTECDTEIDKDIQTDMIDNNSDTQCDIGQTDHSLPGDCVPNIYTESLAEHGEFYHSTPRVMEDVAGVVTKTDDCCNDAEVNLQPISLYSEELDGSSSSNHGTNSPVTGHNR